MSELILECHEYVSFWEKMPQVLNNGHQFSINVDFDPKSNTFKVNSFEECFEHGWILDQSGRYPNELHCRILDGCQNVHEYLEAKALDQEQANAFEDEEDYILDRWGDCDYKGDSYE
jgi:hypothetical protein